MIPSNFKDHFSQQAAVYANARPYYPNELFFWLASLCNSHDLAWDCATGNGQAATSLVYYFQNVVATDASAAQIGNAKPHDRITYRVAKAENSGLMEGSTDLIAVATALHWLEFDAFYTEAIRVLKPNGVLAAWAYGSQNISEKIDRVIKVYTYDILKDFWPPERAYVDTGYSHIPFPSPELKTPQFHCRERWTQQQYINYLQSWSATQRYKDAKGEDPIDLIMKDLSMAWGNPEGPREVVWQVHMKVWRKSNN